jgi:DNA mismatch endonuclease (patch repair protein)
MTAKGARGPKQVIPAYAERSWATSEAVRKNMQANRGRDTTPELTVRRLLHARGLRYRVNLPVPAARRRTIDIAFTRSRLAVFIDGCFWHGCPEHFQLPKSNTAFWDTKISRNRDRDHETGELLRSQGWTVVRFWEHEDPALVEEVIVSRLER